MMPRRPGPPKVELEHLSPELRRALQEQAARRQHAAHEIAAADQAIAEILAQAYGVDEPSFREALALAGMDRREAMATLRRLKLVAPDAF